MNSTMNDDSSNADMQAILDHYSRCRFLLFARFPRSYLNLAHSATHGGDGFSDPASCRRTSTATDTRPYNLVLSENIKTRDIYQLLHVVDNIIYLLLAFVSFTLLMRMCLHNASYPKSVPRPKHTQCTLLRTFRRTLFAAICSAQWSTDFVSFKYCQGTVQRY